MSENPLAERLRAAPEPPAGEGHEAKEAASPIDYTVTALVVGMVCLVATLLTGPSLRFSLKVYEQGSIAQSDVRASRDFLVPDEAATKQKKQEAAQAVLPVYDLSPNALDASLESFEATFEVDAIDPPQEGMADTSTTADAAPDELTTLADAATMQRLFEERWSLSVSEELAENLLDSQRRQRLGNLISKALSPLLGPGVVANRELFMRDARNGITVRDLQREVDYALEDVKAVVDFNLARKELASTGTGPIDSLATLARLMAAALIRPNLVYNQELTAQLRREAAEAAGPVLYQVRRGETLVREGDKVTAVKAKKLQAHASLDSERSLEQKATVRYLVLFLMLFTVTMLCHIYGRRNIRKSHLRVKDYLFISLLFLVLLAIERIGMGLALKLDSELAGAMRFCLPMAAGLMVMRMIFNSETALVYSIPFFLAGAVGAGFESGYFLPLIASGITGAHISGRAWKRMDFFLIGLWVGLVAAFVTLLVCLERGVLSDATGWWMVGGAFISGPLAGLLAMGLVPLAEVAFRYTTDMRLGELASLDHPLLRDLMLRAPGTYHHSMVTGTLVKSAAEAIGARAVLAVVAAYYHDIGKISKPVYFIENQGGSANPHDKLAPSMSTLVLTSHVKEGVELAIKYGLGHEIVDIIRQHHGTSLINFFYNKAKETSRPDVDEVREKDYRYPGPKPQSREAALVLLADAVEAAARTLPDPRPARIQGMVQNIINRIFADGQLDECDLSLKDLHLIARSFTRILSGIHHQRIDYPLAAHKEHKEKREDADTAAKRQPGGGDRRSEDNSKSPENLKRLGM